MTILVFILMWLFHLLAGLGLLSLFRVELKPWLTISLATIIGIGIFSFVPFLMQLLYIPLTALNVWASLIAVTVLCHIRYKQSFAFMRRTMQGLSFKLKLYELPFVALIVFMLFVGAWRCFYFPPTPRDLLSGPEAIAEFTVREKTMLNSVFTVNMESTNNQFKPPFITSLQIIYKYAGFAFGQIWLIMLVASFIMFMYHALAERLHKVIAGLLLVLFIAIPEMYAYTIMALFDYSNAVFFFLSCYFMQLHFQKRQSNLLLLAGCMMGLATYARSETLVLTALLLPLFLIYCLCGKQKLGSMVKDGLLFFVPSVIAYLLSITVFINHYLPVQYDIVDLVNKNLFQVGNLFTKMKTMGHELVFSADGIAYYNYFFFLFFILLVLELLLYRKMNKPALYWLYAILMVYVGLALASHILPLMDISHSIKRGMFKIFPAMLLFMANTRLLTGISTKLKNWEQNLNKPA